MLVLDLKAAAKLLNERENIVLNNGSVRITSKIAVAYLQMIYQHLFRETNITDDVSLTGGPVGISRSAICRVLMLH